MGDPDPEEKTPADKLAHPELAKRTKRVLVKCSQGMSQEEIKKALSQFGEVRKVDMGKRGEGVSFVYFMQPEEALKAINSSGFEAENGKTVTVECPEPTDTLWVGQRNGRLATQQQILEKFSRLYGPIRRHYVKDPRNIFITFDTVESALQAFIKEQNQPIFEHYSTLHIDFHNNPPSGFSRREEERGRRDRDRDRDRERDGGNRPWNDEANRLFPRQNDESNRLFSRDPQRDRDRDPEPLRRVNQRENDELRIQVGRASEGPLRPPQMLGRGGPPPFVGRMGPGGDFGRGGDMPGRGGDFGRRGDDMGPRGMGGDYRRGEEPGSRGNDRRRDSDRDRIIITDAHSDWRPRDTRHPERRARDENLRGGPGKPLFDRRPDFRDPPQRRLEPGDRRRLDGGPHPEDRRRSGDSSRDRRPPSPQERPRDEPRERNRDKSRDTKRLEESEAARIPPKGGRRVFIDKQDNAEDTKQKESTDKSGKKEGEGRVSSEEKKKSSEEKKSGHEDKSGGRDRRNNQERGRKGERRRSGDKREKDDKKNDKDERRGEGRSEKRVRGGRSEESGEKGFDDREEGKRQDVSRRDNYKSRSSRDSPPKSGDEDDKPSRKRGRESGGEDDRVPKSRRTASPTKGSDPQSIDEFAGFLKKVRSLEKDGQLKSTERATLQKLCFRKDDRLRMAFQAAENEEDLVGFLCDLVNE